MICFSTEINECNSNNGGCDQTCTNTVGAFQCSCSAGYQLNTDGLSCEGKLITLEMNIMLIVSCSEPQSMVVIIMNGTINCSVVLLI